MKNALLNKLRNTLERVFQRTAGPLSKTGITPNMLTATSLIIAVAGYVVTLQVRSGLLLALIIALSGFVDVIDGTLARLTGRSSKKGAFLDSFVDRVCEAVFALAFVELGFDPRLVLVFLASSIMISYARARGESLGLQVSGVGLMERAERLIALLVVAVLADYSYTIATIVYLVITILTVYTAIQRFVYLWKTL